MNGESPPRTNGRFRTITEMLLLLGFFFLGVTVFAAWTFEKQLAALRVRVDLFDAFIVSRGPVAPSDVLDDNIRQTERLQQEILENRVLQCAILHQVGGESLLCFPTPEPTPEPTP